jgi:hypothetical protein
MTRHIQLCTYIFNDHHTCGSPALRGERLCYHHHPNRRPIPNTYARRSVRGFTLAAPTNRRELQTALGDIITRLASNKLDVRRASLLLYSLQLAGKSLPNG